MGMGLVKGEGFAVDASVLEANASRHHGMPPNGFQTIKPGAAVKTVFDDHPSANVVKAFNTIAMETFDTSADRLRAGHAQTFLAGNDAASKNVVSSIARELGFDPVDLGGIERARAIEAMGDIIRLVMIDGKRGGRAHLSLTMLPERDLAAVGSRQPSIYG
jgi:predicted dinucleotide-binding enzyme